MHIPTSCSQPMQAWCQTPSAQSQAGPVGGICHDHLASSPGALVPRPLRMALKSPPPRDRLARPAVSPAQQLAGSAHGYAQQLTQAQPQPSFTWRRFMQCLLLGGAALAAPPSLLLLDTGEQAVVGIQHLQQRVLHHRASDVRSLLPLWPPLLPIIMAVAPVGLVLLVAAFSLAGLPPASPFNRQACLAPALVLGASLVLQAYVNLLLIVWARRKGLSPTAAPPAWAAAAPSSSAHSAPQPAAVQLQGAAVQGSIAGRLFAWLQVSGDAVRCACSCYIAWLAVQAASGRTDQAAGVLWGALQQCAHAASSAHLVAASSAAAAAMQQVATVWLPSAFLIAVSLGSAGVYGASLLARCASH